MSKWLSRKTSGAAALTAVTVLVAIVGAGSKWG